MRRGYKFEAQIKKVIDHVNNIGYHAHQNHPLRLINGIFIEGEPYDYEILIPGHHHMFDAKECATDAWSMTKKDIAQADALKGCKNAGCEAYFLIYFASAGVKQVDIDTVIKSLEFNRKTIHSVLGQKWIIPELLKDVRQR